MGHKIIFPGVDELVAVSLSTPFLLVGEEWPKSSQLTFFAGQLPTGAASFSLSFDGSDYGTDMAVAVRQAIQQVNSEWGLTDNWNPGTHRFTGSRSQPFAPIHPPHPKRRPT